MTRPEAIHEALRRLALVQRRPPGFRQIAGAVDVVTDGEHAVSHVTIRNDVLAMLDAGHLVRDPDGWLRSPSAGRRCHCGTAYDGDRCPHEWTEGGTPPRGKHSPLDPNAKPIDPARVAEYLASKRSPVS